MAEKIAFVLALAWFVWLASLALALADWRARTKTLTAIVSGVALYVIGQRFYAL